MPMYVLYAINMNKLNICLITEFRDIVIDNEDYQKTKIMCTINGTCSNPLFTGIK